MSLAYELGLDLHESVMGDDWELIQLIMESRLGNLSVIQPKMIRLLTDKSLNRRSVGLIADIGAASPVEPITDFRMGDLEKILDRSAVLILSYGGNQIFAFARSTSSAGRMIRINFIWSHEWRQVFGDLVGPEQLDKLDKVIYSDRGSASRLKELVKIMIKLSDLEDRQLTLISVGKDPEIIKKGRERADARKGMIPRKRSRVDYGFDKTAGQYTERDAWLAIRDRLDKFKKSRVGVHLKDPTEIIQAMMSDGFFLNVKVGDQVYGLEGTDGDIRDAMKLKDAPGTVSEPGRVPRQGAATATTYNDYDSSYGSFCLRYKLPADVRNEFMTKYYSIKDPDERERYGKTLPPFEFKVYLGTKAGTIVPTEVRVSDKRNIF